MTAIKDIAAERQRQINMEGWTAAHDDAHDLGQIAAAAGVYALVASGRHLDIAAQFWPWDYQWWKPCDARRNLVKAGALIVAEIQRLDRAAGLEAEHTCSSQYRMRELPDPECPACTPSDTPQSDPIQAAIDADNGGQP
jgi:HPt (histidine-containing phosphotransfer) domain-containing protein